MENAYRELPQVRCLEIQLKMRFAGLQLQLKRVPNKQNITLAVKSQAWLRSSARESCPLRLQQAGQPQEDYKST